MVRGMAEGEGKRINIEEIPKVAWTQYGVTESDIEVDEKTALMLLEDLDDEYEDELEFLAMLKDEEERIQRTKRELMKHFEKIAEEMARSKRSSVAIYIYWKNGEPEDMEWQIGAGVCECGEWAYWCDACKENEYETGYRYGLKKGQELEW